MRLVTFPASRVSWGCLPQLLPRLLRKQRQVLARYLCTGQWVQGAPCRQHKCRSFKPSQPVSTGGREPQQQRCDLLLHGMQTYQAHPVNHRSWSQDWFARGFVSEGPEQRVGFQVKEITENNVLCIAGSRSLPQPHGLMSEPCGDRHWRKSFPEELCEARNMNLTAWGLGTRYNSQIARTVVPMLGLDAAAFSPGLWGALPCPSVVRICTLEGIMAPLSRTRASMGWWYHLMPSGVAETKREAVAKITWGHWVWVSIRNPRSPVNQQVRFQACASFCVWRQSEEQDALNSLLKCDPQRLSLSRKWNFISLKMSSENPKPTRPTMACTLSLLS